MRTSHLTLALLVPLTACGGGAQLPTNATPTEAEVARTCDSIRSEVVRVAATNGVNIVKIYEPKTLTTETKKIVCSGRALVGSGESGTIYYRDYQDSDGDWLIEYSNKRLD